MRQQRVLEQACVCEVVICTILPHVYGCGSIARVEEAQEEGSRPASMYRVCDDVTHTEGYGAFQR